MLSISSRPQCVNMAYLLRYMIYSKLEMTPFCQRNVMFWAPGSSSRRSEETNDEPWPCCIFLSKKCKHAFSISSQHGNDTGWRNPLLTHWPLGDLNKILDKSFFKLILVIDGWGISCDIAIRWMSVDLTDDKLTLVQVMAWCHQAKSHYLSQCWPSSMLPYGITRPQWVNTFIKRCIKWPTFCRHFQIFILWFNFDIQYLERKVKYLD